MVVFWLMAVARRPERSGHILEIFKRYYLKGVEIDCMPQEARLCGEKGRECSTFLTWVGEWALGGFIWDICIRF